MGVIVKLLEVTRRQLLYRCVQVHVRGERNSSNALKGGAADGDRISTKISNTNLGGMLPFIIYVP